MSFDIQTLREMGADISRFTLSSDGTIQKQGILHRLKSFFGDREACDANIQTLAIIRQAIQDESDYFADDVKKLGLARIDAMRTDRAIDAAQIRSIIAELDSMSGPDDRKKAQSQRITAYFANPDHHVPACFQGHENEWRSVQNAIRQRLTMKEPQGGFGKQDFAGEIAQYEQAIQGLFDGLADVEGGVEELWGVVQRGGFLRSSIGIRDIADLQAIAANVRSVLTEADALSKAHGPRLHAIVLTSMRDMLRPFPAGTTTQIVNAGLSLPLMGLDRLTARSSVPEIHAAIASFSKKLCTYYFAGKDFTLNGPEEHSAAGALLTETAIDALPEETKRNILAALSTEDGQNLLAFYYTQTSSADSMNIINTISRITEALKTSLGMENPTEELPHPDDPDLSKIPLDIRTAYSIDEIVSGDMFMPGKLGITQYDERIDEFRAKMNAFATATQTVNIASQLSRESAYPTESTVFEADLGRAMKIRMPDGKLLKNGSEKAAKDGVDAIIQFVTGDAKATVESASPTDKIKAHIVMAIMNQSCNGIATNGFYQSLNPDINSESPPFTISEAAGTRVEEYAVGRDERGDITITLKYKCGAQVLSIPNPKTVEDILLDAGSYIEYEVTTKISAANLDALAQADWSQLDCRPLDAPEYRSFQGAFNAANLIPGKYRFTGTTTLLAHVNVIPAH